MKALLVSSTLILTAAALGTAALVPGGGAPRGDCYLEFDVDGREISARAVECTDGDTSCDGDGACDGECRFEVRVCLNQNDPTIPNCTPPFPGSGLLSASERRKNPVGLLFPSFASSACGAFVNVDSPVTRRRKPGRLIKTVAKSPTRPRRDVDVLKLFCRAPAGGCPATTSTTTTTIGSTDTLPSTTSTTTPPQMTTVGATADTGIFSGDPDANLGSFPQIFVGNDASNTQRGLIRFDLSSVPAAATVTSCLLTIDVVTLNGAGAGHVYRVKQPQWGETTATWNRYDGTNTWTTAGAFNAVEAMSDVVVTAGADGPVAYGPPSTSGAFVFPDLGTLCQDAVTTRSGDLNLMIKQDADAPGATAELGFSRRTDSVENERPRLDVTWTQ